MPNYEGERNIHERDTEECDRTFVFSDGRNDATIRSDSLEAGLKDAVPRLYRKYERGHGKKTMHGQRLTKDQYADACHVVERTQVLDDSGEPVIRQFKIMDSTPRKGQEGEREMIIESTSLWEATEQAQREIYQQYKEQAGKKALDFQAFCRHKLNISEPEEIKPSDE